MRVCVHTLRVQYIFHILLYPSCCTSTPNILSAFFLPVKEHQAGMSNVGIKIFALWAEPLKFRLTSYLWVIHVWLRVLTIPHLCPSYSSYCGCFFRFLVAEDLLLVFSLFLLIVSLLTVILLYACRMSSWSSYSSILATSLSQFILQIYFINFRKMMLPRVKKVYLLWEKTV